MSRGPGEYDLLQVYLAAQSGDQIVLTFSEIEAVIGAPLPPPARYRWWWVNAPHLSQARAWLGAGWWAVRPDVPAGRVTFMRRR